MPLRSLAAAAARAGLIRSFGVHPSRRVDLLLTAAIVAAVAGTRWLAFPASIWDIDEAIFVNALVAFDPAANYPHPPFFPLWVALGTVVRTLAPGVDPATALRLVSAFASVWMVFPLHAMWARVLSPRLALAATLLFTLSPVAWLLAGRAYTSTTATALLVAAVAIWLGGKLTLPGEAIGALYLTAALLIRPQLLPVGIALVVWRAWQGREWTSRLLPIAVPVLVGVGVMVLTNAAVGGLDELIGVIGRHGRSHFGALSRFGMDWQSLGVIQAWGGVVPGVIVFLASVHGMVCLWMDRTRPAVVRPLVVVVWLPIMLLLTGAGNPTFLRYTIPYLALSSGFAVASVGYIPHGPRVRRALIAGALTALVAVAVPHLATYRRQSSPAVRCMQVLASGRADQGLHLIVDRSLLSFLDLYANIADFRPTVTAVFEVEGDVVITAGAETTAVYDRGQRDWRLSGSRTLVWSCDDPWLRRFANPRLLDIVAVYGIDGVGETSLLERTTTRTSGPAPAGG